MRNRVVHAITAIVFISICSFWYIERNVQLEKYKSSTNKAILLKIEREFTEKLFLLAVSLLLVKIALMGLIAYRQNTKICQKDG